jgi:hypothetical protein
MLLCEDNWEQTMYTLDANIFGVATKTTAPLGEYQERGCREGGGEVFDAYHYQT